MIFRLIRKILRPFEKLSNSLGKRARMIYYKFRAKAAPPRARAKKNRHLEIEVVTMMYNEAILAPLFVRHYAPWADKLTVFYSESTDDTSRQLEKTAAECNVKSLMIVPFEFPNGFDDKLKIKCINQTVRKSSADFVVCVDADEFVYPWPFAGADPRRELAKETGNVVRCNMFNVYRHSTDKDIDPQQPPLFQRRHGLQDVSREGQTQLHDKPCIVRPDCWPEFELGCHRVRVPYPKWSTNVWRGAHWGKADAFCLQRYLRDRRDRLSKTNRHYGFGKEHSMATAEQIRAELKAHENDPQLF